MAELAKGKPQVNPKPGKHVAYVFIKIRGGQVKRILRKVNATFQGNDHTLEDYVAHEPSPALIKRFSDRGFQFCNWHFVEVSA